jgi:hypothetical protein
MTMLAGERTRSEYAGLLVSVIDFMIRSGIRNEEVRDIVYGALKKATEKRKPRHTEKISDADLAVAALALDAWHRNRRYLDEDAQPKPIRLLGRGPSVEALLRSENACGDATALARRLRSTGLIIRCGANQYKPADRVAVVSDLDPLIQQYVARSSSTLLETIRYNVTRPANVPRLIERFAEIPDLPAKHVRQFRDFTRTQGWALLKTLNDWLESRRAKRSRKARGPSVRAGLHLYAYVDPTVRMRGLAMARTTRTKRRRP